MNEAEKIAIISQFNAYLKVTYDFIGYMKFDEAIKSLEALKALQPSFEEATK